MDDFGLLGLDFAAARTWWEREFARHAVCDPASGVEIARELGLTPEHFEHYDLRLCFCACLVACDHPGADARSLASRAMIRENLHCPSWLSYFIKPCEGMNPLFHILILYAAGRRIISMHTTERDANEHLRYAVRLIKKSVREDAA